MKTLYIHIGVPKQPPLLSNIFAMKIKKYSQKTEYIFLFLNKNIKMSIHIATDIFLLPISMIPMEKSIL